MDLNDNYINFLQALNSTNTEYLLVGGFAVVVHGHNRTTGDMDLWINHTKENHSRLKEALVNEGYGLADVDQAIDALSKETKLTIWIENDLIELLPIYSSLLQFETAYKKRFKVEFGNGIQVPVIDLDHLIETKIKSGRDKDLWDASELKKRR